MKTSRRANRETPARDNPVESCKRIRFDNEVFTQTPWKGYFVSNRIVGKQNRRSRYKIKKFTKSQETIEITFY